MRLIFRILDLDVSRLKESERLLRRLVRARGMSVDIYLINDFLELGRVGVADRLPALEVNGVIMNAGRDLTETMLDQLLSRLKR